MQNQEEKTPTQQGDDLFDTSKAERRAHFAMRVASDLTLPFRRCRGGSQSPGKSGAMAFVVLFGWAFMSHSLFCLWYAELWVVLMVIYRIGMDRAAHSLAEGIPFLKFVFRNFLLASAMEPVALLALGYWLYLWVPAFGLIFLASGVGTAVNEIVEWQHRRRIIIEYTDGHKVMEYHRALYKRAGR